MAEQNQMNTTQLVHLFVVSKKVFLMGMNTQDDFIFNISHIYAVPSTVIYISFVNI